MSKVIVIGSGFGGLGVAIRLAARGHEVTIFEKRDKIGGRAYVYDINGFKFDGGPTVLTAPFMFDDLWEAAGKNREDYFQTVPCDPFYRIFDHNKRAFDYNGDENFILGEIEKWNPADKAGYKAFMKTTKAIFEKGFVELADKPISEFHGYAQGLRQTLSVCNLIRVFINTHHNLLKMTFYGVAFHFILY